MTILRWDPFKDLLNIQGEVNKLFDEKLYKKSKPNLGQFDFEPPVDILENKNSFSIQIELAGMEEKDISISIENDVLTIKGEKILNNKDKKGNYHRIERLYGNFQRQFTLPNSIDTNKIQAKSDKGIIYIDLPKKEEIKPKKINIEIE